MTPDDILIRLKVDVPLVWAERRGREWLGSAPVDAPVVLRGVEPAALRRVGDRHSLYPTAEYAGHLWSPFKRNPSDLLCPPGTFRDACEAEAHGPFRVRFPEPLVRKDAAYPLPEAMAARAVERPEAASVARAVRFVSDFLVHDGERVWQRQAFARPGTGPDLAALDESTFRTVVTDDTMRLLAAAAAIPRHRRDPDGGPLAAAGRRILVRGHADAIGPEARRQAYVAVLGLANSVYVHASNDYAIRHAGLLGDRLQKALDAKEGPAAEIPAEDELSLEGLSP